jgi:hypothetical protein
VTLSTCHHLNAIGDEIPRRQRESHAWQSSYMSVAAYMAD